ncbi:hypothetical protein BH09BAC3_BH09BAC3_30320 [soil metagenome]
MKIMIFEVPEAIVENLAGKSLGRRKSDQCIVRILIFEIWITSFRP